jgi:hypothetical protein
MNASMKMKRREEIKIKMIKMPKETGEVCMHSSVNRTEWGWEGYFMIIIM